MYMLDNDIKECLNLVKKAYPYFQDLDDVRQNVLLELMFNLGPSSLFQFKNMHHYLAIKDYKNAAKALKNSKWYNDVGEIRGNELVEMLEHGNDLS